MPTITVNYEVDQSAIYGVVAGDDYASIVDDKYANYAAAAAALPGMAAYWVFQAIANANFTQANFMALSWMSATFGDAHWQTDGYTSEAAYPDNSSQSRGNILLAAGGFRVNFPLIYGFGRYVGRGSANYTPVGSQTMNLSGGTGGGAAANGYYNRAGNANGRPNFEIDGGATDDSISWDGATKWVIKVGGVSMYEAAEDVTYPHKVTSWTNTGGTGTASLIFPGSTWGTSLIIDHNYWLTDCMEERHCAQSHSWGDETNAGYNEGAQWSHCRFIGSISEVDAWIADPGHYDPTYSSSGLAMWSAGSASSVSHCFAHDFNNFGFLFANKGTPVTIYNCSSFSNQQGAVGVIGSAVLNCFALEADDNPAIFYARGGYEEDPCILNLYAFGTKSEDGVTPSRYQKGQCLIDAEGWINATFIGVRMASNTSYPDVICRVKGANNTSYVSVTGLQIFNYYRTLLHDVENGKKYLVDQGEYAKKWFSGIHSFEWWSGQNGNMKTTFVLPRVITNCAENRLMWLDESAGNPVGSFDDVAGTPPYVE